MGGDAEFLRRQVVVRGAPRAAVASRRGAQRCVAPAHAEELRFGELELGVKMRMVFPMRLVPWACDEQGHPNRWESVQKPWEPVVLVRTGSSRFQTGLNSKFEFELKMKKSHKILKNTSRYVKSNGFN
jgi:hypothetical protein